ncbi:MAG: hypothetical protein WD749_05095 [Phycisphaerales bacterium]
MTMPDTIRLNVLLYREHDCWVARCVELDLVTSGPDLWEVAGDIQEVVKGQMLYACAKDPELTDLFRPVSEELRRKVMTGREKGEMLVEMDGHLLPAACQHKSVKIHYVMAEAA